MLTTICFSLCLEGDTSLFELLAKAKLERRGNCVYLLFREFFFKRKKYGFFKDIEDDLTIRIDYEKTEEKNDHYGMIGNQDQIIELSRISIHQLLSSPTRVSRVHAR